MIPQILNLDQIDLRNERNWDHYEISHKFWIKLIWKWGGGELSFMVYIWINYLSWFVILEIYVSIKDTTKIKLVPHVNRSDVV